MNAAATPKQIRELMKVDGLTNDEVKSHLQVRIPPYQILCCWLLILRILGCLSLDAEKALVKKQRSIRQLEDEYWM